LSKQYACLWYNGDDEQHTAQAVAMTYTIIGWVLQGGVILSATIIVIGLCLEALRPDKFAPQKLHLFPQAVIALGLLLLVATPVVRVAVSIVVSTVAKFVEQAWTTLVYAALDQSSLPAFLIAFGQVISPGHVRESTRAGTCPLRTSASPTTLTCMLICIRAWPARARCPSTGFFPPTCSRRERVASNTALRSLGRWLLAWLPMPLAIERAMHIHARIEVGIRLVVTHWASEQLAPPRLDALAAKVREPLPLGAAAAAILAGAMRIHLDGHGACGVCLVFAVSIDLAA
jgi:uncharacterized membrane protein